MSFHALVVDDHQDILDDVKDRLDSMGHTCDCASCQAKARELLEDHRYSYILLDLEIPVKYGRKSRIQTGQNLLSEIRKIKGYESIPVIVMTSHGKDSPQLAVDVMRCNGANDYVIKPFVEDGHTLEKAIMDVLRTTGLAHPAAKKLTGRQLPTEPPRKFEAGEMVFYPSHVELCGIKICGDTSFITRRILDILRKKKGDGGYVRHCGNELAEMVGCDGGQIGIASCIMGFRTSVCNALYSEAQIESDRLNDFIPNDRKYGYSLSDKIKVRDGDVPQLSANVPQNVRQSPRDVRQSEQENDDWNDRQRWILQELEKGIPLQNKHVRDKFKVCEKTAQRDLADLRIRGLLDFTGPSRTGVWRLR